MGVYQGLFALKTEGAQLVFYYQEKGLGLLRQASFDDDSRRSADIEWQILINANTPPDEQVRTFIHECLHLTPEFRPHITAGTNRLIEPVIDELVEEVFKSQPVLVERIRSTIVQQECEEYLRREQEWHNAHPYSGIAKVYSSVWKRRK